MRFEQFFLHNLHFSFFTMARKGFYFFIPFAIHNLFRYQRNGELISDNLCNNFRVYSKLLRCRWLSETQRASLLQDLLRLTENLPTNSTERFALLFSSKTCFTSCRKPYFLLLRLLLRKKPPTVWMINPLPGRGENPGDCFVGNSHVILVLRCATAAYFLEMYCLMYCI
jgi:hypothetical protein